MRAPDVAGDTVQAAGGASYAVLKADMVDMAAEAVAQQAKTIWCETMAAIWRAQAFRKRLDAAERGV